MNRYRVFEWGGYLVFVLLLGTVLFVAGFPLDTAVRWGLFQVEERTGVRVEPGTVRYAPLFGVRGGDVLVRPSPQGRVGKLPLG
ncbi:MAG TPA: hypothetical protein VJ934_01325, partial [Desulfomicrobiaceae bacterium]|nr:hypothetical protein [Desulfomicrobiaceae bacterium]